MARCDRSQKLMQTAPDSLGVARRQQVQWSCEDSLGSLKGCAWKQNTLAMPAAPDFAWNSCLRPVCQLAVQLRSARSDEKHHQLYAQRNIHNCAVQILELRGSVRAICVRKPASLICVPLI